MPTHIQLVYLEHIKMHLVDGEFQFASADITNGPNVDVVLRLFFMVIYVINLKSTKICYEL